MSHYEEDINKYLIAFKNGDRSQFDTFFHKYHDRFLSYAVYFLVNKDHREDIISEAYMKICMYISSFDPNEDGYSWIIKIIQNTARTQNRKDLRQKCIDIENIYLADEHDSYAEIDMEMYLAKLFNQKKDYKNYIIAVLIICKGRQQEEVAKMLGISESAVSQRMSKIRAIIKNNIKQLNF